MLFFSGKQNPFLLCIFVFNLFKRCAPLSLVLDVQGQKRQEYGTFPAPNGSQSLLCPVCRAGVVLGVGLVPLCFRDLERAVQLRKSYALAEAKSGTPSQKRKHPGDEAPELYYAEAAYLLLSNSSRSSSLSSSSGLSDREQQRTGRWTDEEIAFVDYLVSAFDQGALPLPHGIKLNDFLGDMLICKSSRLTKKMKNAKLSTRSFVLCSPHTQTVRNDCAVLSSLQEKFLMSVSSEPTQLELRFNITKQWRTHFSNLSVQIGYPFLDGKDWVASLEEMERRASNAEEMVRKVRRRRMGLALQTDGGSSANPNVFIGGVKADSAATQLQPVLSLGLSQRPSETQTPSARKLSTSEGEPGREKNGDEDDFAMFVDIGANDTSSSEQQGRPRSFSEDFLLGRPRSFSEDFDAVLNDLMESETHPTPAPTTKKTNNRSVTTSPNHPCGPFLDAIVMYMESNNLPFQHADIWVPSFLPRDSNGPSKAVDTEQLRLFHAGHATRGDLEEPFAYALHEFGVYSDNFSFEPGHGLPGRVYSSGEPMWECDADECGPKLFERAGGAKVYGVKTAFGIPINTPLVGRMVVAMYSRDAIPEDMTLAMNCAAELVKYSPEPKWKLVIDMNDSETTPPPTESSQNSQHNARNDIAASTATNLPNQVEIRQAVYLPRGFPTQLVGCKSPDDPNESSRMDTEEQSIVSLLGEHMPLSDSSAVDSSSSAGNASNLLPDIMSIRLLLLRPAIRRTSRENEMIDILKNSFRAYAKDNRRSGVELANLLAKDWICLKSTFAASGVSSSLEPNALRPIRRQSSTGSTIKALPPLMSTNYLLPSNYGPMKPPSKFISPPTSLKPMMSMNMNYNQTEICRESTYDAGTGRRHSIHTTASRRGSSFSEGSHQVIQPLTVRSSKPDNAHQAVSPKSNIVFEH